MGWLTLLGFGVVGFILIHFVQGRDWMELLFRDYHLGYQLSLGIILGLLIAKILLLIVELPGFADMRHYFVELIGPIDLSLPLIVFISFCAGFGEELFFRGAIQHWLGLWITAVLFVLLHGYIQPKNWKLSVYGILLILASAAFGYMTVHIGLVSAMVAHATYDVVMFRKINQFYRSEKEQAPNHQSSPSEFDTAY